MEKSKNLSLFVGVNQEEGSVHFKLHKEFVRMERITPSDCPLSINYSFSVSPFGELLVASTSKGVCYMAFYEDQLEAIQQLKARFSRSTFAEQLDPWHTKIAAIFREDGENLETINLHLQGTEFQFEVWNELLKIPLGELSTYGEIAQDIGKPKASRAVGTAIGSNPVAFVVPCHRVVQKSGKLGGYMWGTERKKKLISWEAEKIMN